MKSTLLFSVNEQPLELQDNMELNDQNLLDSQADGLIYPDSIDNIYCPEPDPEQEQEFIPAPLPLIGNYQGADQSIETFDVISWYNANNKWIFWVLVIIIVLLIWLLYRCETAPTILTPDTIRNSLFKWY
jgi:hypothetical protein